MPSATEPVTEQRPWLSTGNEPGRARGLLAGLVPAGVVTAEAFRDPEGPPRAYLFPEEQALVARAVAGRQREFATTRSCARRALSTLGHLPAPLLPDPRGAPGWPDGVAGSLTHCHGYRAAAVAPTRRLASLGIDAEPDAPLPDGVLDGIALEQERDLVRRLTCETPGVSWDRLLFSAKESVFKTWYPLTRRELRFSEARIDLDPAAGTFTARLLTSAPCVVDGTPLTRFTGRWTTGSGLIVTAVGVPRAPV